MRTIVIQISAFVISPLLVAAQTPCSDGTACQLASAVIQDVLFQAGDLDGRNVFVDMTSLSALDTILPGGTPSLDIQARVERPFRTDMQSAAPFRPSSRHSLRWGADPYVIRLLGAVRVEGRVIARIELRYNVRNRDNIAASAVTAEVVRGEYILDLRQGRWIVVSSRRLAGPS
jgi:hypothetical protein